MRSKRKISLTVDEDTFELFRSYCYGSRWFIKNPLGFLSVLRNPRDF